jgi:uncharacterized protein YdeI (YjbR/CyaY-like superfamily)
MKLNDMNLVKVDSRDEWRAWLANNNEKTKEAWLVYYKQGAGVSGVDYESSVEEALCFGWVDSIIKKIDGVSYARKFTPRKSQSKWSPTNITRVEKMIKEGRMSAHGLTLVDDAKRTGSWDNPVSKPVFDLTMPPEFEKALQANRAALEQYEKLPMSHRKEYLLWIVTAKRPETRDRRIAESIRLLEEGKQLGLR